MSATVITREDKAGAIPDVTSEAAEGRIADEALAAARAMIEVKLQPERSLRDASVDTITNFSNGIGDLNRLFRDLEYARWTHSGGMVAHPCFPWVHHWPGRSYWGLPGVHGFGVAIDCQFYRHVHPRRSDQHLKSRDGRQGKALALLRPDGAAICGIHLHQPARRGPLPSGSAAPARHERKASRDAGKSKEVKQHVNLAGRDGGDEPQGVDRAGPHSRAADALLRGCRDRRGA